MNLYLSALLAQSRNGKSVSLAHFFVDAYFSNFILCRLVFFSERKKKRHRNFSDTRLTAVIAKTVNKLS